MKLVDSLLWRLRDIKSVRSIDPRWEISCKRTGRIHHTRRRQISRGDSLERWLICIARQLQNGSETISKHQEALNEEFRNGRGIYSKTINQCFKKGYIRKVDPTEKNSSKKYYLSHFPDVKPELTKTEKRIVFDPSAKCDGVSLNNASIKGRKCKEHWKVFCSVFEETL